MSARDVITKAIQDSFKPALAARGFRKKALTFQRRRDAAVHVIDVQLSQGNFADDGRFYVNVGIGFDALWQMGGVTDKDPTRAYECHYSQRIKHLLEDAPDAWEVNAGTDVAALAADLRARAEALAARLDPVDGPAAMLRVFAPELEQNPELRARLRYVEDDLPGALEDLRRTAALFADRRGMSVADLIARHRLDRLSALAGG